VNAEAYADAFVHAIANYVFGPAAYSLTPSQGQFYSDLAQAVQDYPDQDWANYAIYAFLPFATPTAPKAAPPPPAPKPQPKPAPAPAVGTPKLIPSSCARTNTCNRASGALSALPAAALASLPRFTFDALGRLISQDGGGIVSHDGGSVVSNDGGTVIGEHGSGLRVLAGAGQMVLVNSRAYVVSNDGGTLISQDGSNFKSEFPRTSSARTAADSR